jgi:hypothetical protein
MQKCYGEMSVTSIADREHENNFRDIDCAGERRMKLFRTASKINL